MFTIPAAKYLAINSNSSLSLLCWVILNLNFTWYPILFELDLKISKKKFPSPLTKPEIQLESGILVVLIVGLSTGTVLIKLDFNSSERPALRPIEALIFIIFCKPSVVRCALELINSTTCFKKKKSAALLSQKWIFCKMRNYYIC
jgi:tryptophan-rich sensory protein